MIITVLISEIVLEKEIIVVFFIFSYLNPCSPAHIIGLMQWIGQIANETFDELRMYEFHAAIGDAFETKLNGVHQY